uniref:GNAT family N-acetyltransferase n=1 Tax=Winogradskyella sp. TaxID=1883156 RepID=UPI0035124E00
IQKTFFDIHILGIGVLESHRNNSIAKKLTQELISYFELSDFNKILLEVRQSNDIAMKLYKSFGFKKYGVRKNYYVNEDANLFHLEKIYA